MLILSNMVLLIFPVSDFDGFINLYGILFESPLWSLIVIYDSFSYIRSVRFTVESSFAIDFVRYFVIDLKFHNCCSVQT